MKAFNDIHPYNDAQAVKALKRCSFHPLTAVISKYVYPDKPWTRLGQVLRTCNGVDDFQRKVMAPAIRQCIQRTSDGFEFSGIENIDRNRRHLFVSNHRDIVMDPALTQYALIGAGLPSTAICVGSNLLISRYIEDIMRSNRMIEVHRNLPAHERYLAAEQLSSYVRGLVVRGESDVWIAQRQGRAKDSRDKTGQSVLKMFNMSGKKNFVDNFDELSIIPISISYEYESCDIQRACEIYISRRQQYVKGALEDLNSMKTGIFGKKGKIHLSFCKALTREELEECSQLNGNASFLALCKLIDSRITEGYHPFPTNFMAVDLLHNTHDYETQYEGNIFGNFSLYIDRQISKVKNKKITDLDELKDILLRIYANPVLDQCAAPHNVERG